MRRFTAGLLFLLIASVFILVYNLFGAIIVSLNALLNSSGQSLPPVITMVMMAILVAGAIYVLVWLVQKVGRRGR